MTHSIRSLVCAALVVATPACRQGQSADAAKTAPAAKVDNAKPEGALATVTLTPEAEAHLALKTVTVSFETIAQTRTVGGEAMVPPGRSVTVSAPVAGTLTLPPGRSTPLGAVKKGDVLFELVPLQQAERDVRGAAERDVREAEARFNQTSQRLTRLEQLLKEGSTSVRSVEEARADRTVAEAALQAAQRRLASLALLPVGPRGELKLEAPFDAVVLAVRAAAGQTVAAGSAVVELAQTGALWVRAPVFAGDLPLLDPDLPAAIAALGRESGPWQAARRASGPPAADPTAASVDLYFDLPAGLSMRPGERVAVRLSLRARERALVVPASAVVYDLNGGTWVYERIAAHAFARRRIELGGQSGGQAIVRRGLAEGQTIVSVGAAELYGTEFFVSK